MSQCEMYISDAERFPYSSVNWCCDVKGHSFLDGVQSPDILIAWVSVTSVRDEFSFVTQSAALLVYLEVQINRVCLHTLLGFI